MRKEAEKPGLAVWTVGHSTRTPDEFPGLLAAHQIEAVADVRRYPGSRKHPQFNQDALRRSLAEAGIEYVTLPELGGRRPSCAPRRYGGGATKPTPSPPPPGWSMASCRIHPMNESEEGIRMPQRFKIGDHVTWNSEAGHVSGTIIKIHTGDFDYKGYTHHASPDDPQYEIRSDRTDHVAAHKGSALKKARR